MHLHNGCPSCGSEGVHIFYELPRVPVHSVQLFRTRDLALNSPKGDIALGFCRNCGFISNIAFDPGLQDYSSEYESTQAYSPTYNSFAMRLAKFLVARYNLHDKDILEIGSGQGEFLTLLCELGPNHGVGFDPAYIGGRITSEANDRITFIKDFYSEKYAGSQADFICCRMTLEHVQDTADFVSTIRRSIGSRSKTVVFFQVPETTRVLEERAFWDIYYEHCSYFSLGSLGHLFRHCGFDVTDIWQDYDDQYLMIDAKPGHGKQLSSLPQEGDIEVLTQSVYDFSADVQQRIEVWKSRLREVKQKRQRAVLWGGSSKGVAFLTTLRIEDEIEYVVDINPLKQGTYMAGTGQEIISPEFLMEYKPDIVIVMNPIYRNEIREELTRLNLTPELVSIES